MESQERETIILYCNLLSAMTIFISFFSKLPQIIKLIDQKSVTGLSLYSLLLELGSYTVTASYNFANGYALLSYLEYPVIIIQELILIYLYLLYVRNSNYRTNLLVVSLCLLYGLVAVCMCTGIVPSKILSLSIMFSTPVSLYSKVLQLRKIWRIESADSVSVPTWFLSTFTNSARLYTIMMDSADKILLTNFAASTALALSIMLSAIHFQRRDESGSKKIS